MIINELLRQKLGFTTNQQAVGESFYGMPDDDGLETFRYDIIGVVETHNILGLHNDIKPFIFRWSYVNHYYGGIRIKQGAPASVVQDIEDVWQVSRA